MRPAEYFLRNETLIREQILLGKEKNLRKCGVNENDYDWLEFHANGTGVTMEFTKDEILK